MSCIGLPVSSAGFSGFGGVGLRDEEGGAAELRKEDEGVAVVTVTAVDGGTVLAGAVPV